LRIGQINVIKDSTSRMLDEIRRATKSGPKTRYRLSKETGIPESQLSRLMTGEKGLSFDSLDRLAEALDLEIIIRRKITQEKLKQRTVKHGKCDK